MNHHSGDMINEPPYINFFEVLKVVHDVAELSLIATEDIISRFDE